MTDVLRSLSEVELLDVDRRATPTMGLEYLMEDRIVRNGKAIRNVLVLKDLAGRQQQHIVRQNALFVLDHLFDLQARGDESG